MLFVSSRRCLAPLTVFILFWVIFLGTIVAYPPRKLTDYTSKIGLGREHVEPSQTPQPPPKAGDVHSIPESWLKNTLFLQGEESNIATPDNQTPLTATPEISNSHKEVFSNITPHRGYFKVDFGKGNVGINPNIIPHPYDPSLWIIVAQEFHGTPGDGKPSTPWSVEMVCNANLTDDAALRCIKSPIILPIASTPISPNCPPELEAVNLNVGPRDARVFYGPGIPYTTFGSQSKYGCLGQHVQDFRYLVDWGMFRMATDVFPMVTDIEKPNPGPMEKNYFLFWDLDGTKYAHYDIHPQRIFSRLADDGTASADLAPLAVRDAQCWQKHLSLNPLPTEFRSSIHQATNSLAITLCRRADPTCLPTSDNTFLFHIFQHKIYTTMFHSRYEPFIVLFRPSMPFALHAVTAKPLWIHGRRDTDQMLYITSMSWKTHGQTYQGFLDDTLFVSFGIDDHDTGAIDVTVGDLFDDLMECS